MKRLFALLLATTLVMAACSSDDGGGELLGRHRTGRDHRAHGLRSLLTDRRVPGRDRAGLRGCQPRRHGELQRGCLRFPRRPDPERRHRRRVRERERHVDGRGREGSRRERPHRLRDEPARHHHPARQPGRHPVDRRSRDPGGPTRASRRRSARGRLCARGPRQRRDPGGGARRTSSPTRKTTRASSRKITANEADAAIVYTSDVSDAAGNDVNAVTIPEDVNVIATYPIAVVEGALNADLAADFVAYVVSSDGQATLKEYGFEPTA